MNPASHVLSLFLIVISAVASWCAVGVVRRYALRRLLDVPNDRSSHAMPTPRGGGLGFALVHVASIFLAASYAMVRPELFAALVGGGIVVSLVGFLDDHGHVSASLRLACHFTVFAWAIWWLGGLPAVDFGWGPVNLSWLGSALLMLYLAWFLNLFNFMDGIDGIAGMQAATMCGSAALLVAHAGQDWRDALPLWLLVAATVGFLSWNWPPAKVFMGDVGSGYLGYVLGVLALWTVVEGWLTPWVWLILGGAFLADATVTLVVRARSGVRVTSAHCSHAYQRLSRRYGSHRVVTTGFFLVNLFWLAPWAWVATTRPAMGAMASVLSLVPLFFAAARLGAGRPDQPATVR
jgi:Fuc2NAc and GlcNAc transferase